MAAGLGKRPGEELFLLAVLELAAQHLRGLVVGVVLERFGEQVWNVWLWHAPWAVAEASNVHGILGPDLPGEGGAPSGRLVTGHSLLGLWIDRG